MERREHEYKGTRLLNSCNSLSLSLSFVCSLFLCLCRGKKAVTLAKTQEKLRYFLDSTQKYCWIWAKTVLCILPAFPPPLLVGSFALIPLSMPMNLNEERSWAEAKLVFSSCHIYMIQHLKSCFFWFLNCMLSQSRLVVAV